MLPLEVAGTVRLLALALAVGAPLPLPVATLGMSKYALPEYSLSGLAVVKGTPLRAVAEVMTCGSLGDVFVDHKLPAVCGMPDRDVTCEETVLLRVRETVLEGTPCSADPKVKESPESRGGSGAKKEASSAGTSTDATGAIAGGVIWPDRLTWLRLVLSLDEPLTAASGACLDDPEVVLREWCSFALMLGSRLLSVLEKRPARTR